MRIFVLIFVFLFIISCDHKKNTSENDSAVSGAFTMYCDEGYFPLVKVLTDGYMAIYPQVVISIDTSVTVNVYENFSGKTIRLAITCFPLNQTDSLALAQRNIYPHVFHFASDAVALIEKASDSVNNTSFSNLDFLCSTNTGKNNSSRIITDQSFSENNRFIAQGIPGYKPCLENWYAAGSQEAILRRISENSGEIGIVSWCHLCEKENPEVNKWRSLINIIPYRSTSSGLIYPTPSALTNGSYVLTRKLYMVTAEPYAGPATGFAAFVASSEGQRIIRLFGLAPTQIPPREIYIPKK